MYFTRPEIDSPLLAELYSHQVVSQAMWNGLSKPEEGTLTDVLKDNSEQITPGRWAYWLVKRHGFSRVPNLLPDPHFYGSLRWTQARERDANFYGCYPLSVRGGVAHLVSLRPDIQRGLPEILKWLGAVSVFMFVLTPNELGTWENFIRKTV